MANTELLLDIPDLDCQDCHVSLEKALKNRSVINDIKFLTLFRRESGARVITIEETRDGKVDLADLEAKLSIENSKGVKSKKSFLLIGCFTAASNVTGQVKGSVKNDVIYVISFATLHLHISCFFIQA